MTRHGDKQCIGGALYQFESDDPDSDAASPMERLIALVKRIADHYTWEGSITPMEFVVPANSQRKSYSIFPAARTIRIEADAAALIWLNTDRGVAIPIGGDRRVFYISDLPPKAAIHDIVVTTVEETRLYVLAVA